MTAWTLGLRHAFDADHIAAIDNTTRKLMNDGKRPFSVGILVFPRPLVDRVGARVGARRRREGGLWPGGKRQFAAAQVRRDRHLVSGAFLYLIAALNVVIIAGSSGSSARCGRRLRRGRARAEAQTSAGSSTACSGTDQNDPEARPDVPVGVLFGLGFDTATEVALLVNAGSRGSRRVALVLDPRPADPVRRRHVPVDTLDGSFMNYAYEWAFARPVRKVYYNLDDHRPVDHGGASWSARSSSRAIFQQST